MILADAGLRGPVQVSSTRRLICAKPFHALVTICRCRIPIIVADYHGGNACLSNRRYATTMDPTQAKIMLVLRGHDILFVNFPAGFVVLLTNNTLTISNNCSRIGLCFATTRHFVSAGAEQSGSTNA